MARKGENIRKRKDGRWEGRYQIFEDGTKKTKSVYAHSYKEVKQKLLEKKSNAQKHEFEITINYVETENRITLNDIATNWFENFPNENKHSTYVKYKDVYENHIKPKLGNDYIVILSNEYVNQHIDPTLSQSVTKSIYSVLNQISKYGEQRYHIPEKTYHRNITKATKQAIDTLDYSEQSKLIKSIFHNLDVYKLGIYICLVTGLRLGEICALKWSDIDMDLRLLHVNRTVQRISVENANSKTILMETPPKSFHSKREIPISNQLYILLQLFKCDDVYVLGGSKPMEPRTLQYKFKNYLFEADIRDTNFHTLRHTFATNCIQAGADAKSVSEVLGHSDVKITLNRYVHPSVETKREHLNALSSIYGQMSGQLILEFKESAV